MHREVVLDDATLALIARYRELLACNPRHEIAEAQTVLALGRAMLNAVPAKMWVANVYYNNGTTRRFDVTRKFRDVKAQENCADDIAMQHVEMDLANIYPRAVIEVQEVTA